MLLIDARGRFRSVTSFTAPVPFLYVRPMGVDGALSYLAGFRDDVWFVRALTQEMQVVGGAAPVQKPYPGRLIEAAARAAASRLLQIGVEISDTINVAFDPLRARERPGFDFAVFPNPRVAADYLSRLLSDSENSAAFANSLLHPAGSEYLGVTETATGQPADRTGLVSRIAPMLSRQYLLLQPVDGAKRRFRLLWADRTAPVALIADAEPAAADPPRPRAPVAVTRPASGLPDAPDDVSPQAQTLIDAAQSGAPFCEECARRAAEMANAC